MPHGIIIGGMKMKKNEILIATAIFLISALLAGLLILGDIVMDEIESLEDSNVVSEKNDSNKNIVAYYNPATKTVMYRAQ